jgi:hypothetical protein
MQRLNGSMGATDAPPREVVRDEDIPAMLGRPVWTRTRQRAGAREDDKPETAMGIGISHYEHHVRRRGLHLAVLSR